MADYDTPHLSGSHVSWPTASLIYTPKSLMVFNKDWCTIVESCQRAVNATDVLVYLGLLRDTTRALMLTVRTEFYIQIPLRIDLLPRVLIDVTLSFLSKRESRCFRSISRNMHVQVQFSPRNDIFFREAAFDVFRQKMKSKRKLPLLHESERCVSASAHGRSSAALLKDTVTDQGHLVIQGASASSQPKRISTEDRIQFLNQNNMLYMSKRERTQSAS